MLFSGNSAFHPCPRERKIFYFLLLVAFPSCQPAWVCTREENVHDPFSIVFYFCKSGSPGLEKRGRRNTGLKIDTHVTCESANGGFPVCPTPFLIAWTDGLHQTKAYFPLFPEKEWYWICRLFVSSFVYHPLLNP
ncbi:hypothetical protein CEXT_649961 [Caerostris extrusa]|uniref:Secreted protein n=1 Tax=Caerostris extrusa TaxID=172846 RepID=A0AAV4M5J1_CAEEX|nr:hypothetical protein CEXT_649961 [Caerostris extrusa]